VNRIELQDRNVLRIRFNHNLYFKALLLQDSTHEENLHIFMQVIIYLFILIEQI